MDKNTPRFSIFRCKDAKTLDESGVMNTLPPSTAVLQEMRHASSEAAEEGHFTQVLFSQNGVSLAYAWFKSGYPLPRHRHNCDCLYYIIGGSLRLGTEELGKGDGFFVGEDVPYAYTPGDEGVEVLEFRTAESFNIELLASNPAFWMRFATTKQVKQDAWHSEVAPPSGMAAIKP